MAPYPLQEKVTRTRLQQIAVVHALVDAHADVTSPDTQDCTPLLHAIRVGNSEMVRLLLERKADPDIESSAGVNLVFSFRDPPNPECVRIVRRHYEVSHCFSSCVSCEL